MASCGGGEEAAVAAEDGERGALEEAEKLNTAQLSAAAATPAAAPTAATPAPETQGNLMGRPLDELSTYAVLNGIMQHRIGADRPEHVPLALLPSPFPRCEFERGRDVLCTAILRLYDAAARDRQWLRAALEGAAADEAARGEEPRLRRMLEMLPLSPQRTTLGILRTDFMLHRSGEGAARIKQIETNTISAAFSQISPRVQRLHARLVARRRQSGGGGGGGGGEGEGGGDGDGNGGEVPLMRSDIGVVDALAAANAAYQRSTARGGSGSVVLFVVLDKAHLLCENLMEQNLAERHGVATATLTLGGCARRLSLGEPLARPAAATTSGGGGSAPLRPLLLDSERVVTVVYFRAGISNACWEPPGCLEGTLTARWAARALIERSAAIKCPDAGWWLAGTKAAQAVLGTPAAIDRLVPRMDRTVRAQLLTALTRMRPVGDAAAEADARAAPSAFIVKKEPLGVWADADLIAKLDAFRRAGTGGARDHFIMDKLAPAPACGVSFVRGGRVTSTGRGVQELGFYGVCLGDGEREEFASCVGYLVRTKPEEVDGGVCKGVAVVDSLLLV